MNDDVLIYNKRECAWWRAPGQGVSQNIADAFHYTREQGEARCRDWGCEALELQPVT